MCIEGGCWELYQNSSQRYAIMYFHHGGANEGWEWWSETTVPDNESRGCVLRFWIGKVSTWGVFICWIVYSTAFGTSDLTALPHSLLTHTADYSGILYQIIRGVAQQQGSKCIILILRIARRGLIFSWPLVIPLFFKSWQWVPSLCRLLWSVSCQRPLCS